MHLSIISTDVCGKFTKPSSASASCSLADANSISSRPALHVSSNASLHTHTPSTARPLYLNPGNQDNRYHPQEVFLGHDGFRRVRQCQYACHDHDRRYPPHPMHALPDTPISNMYPSHHGAVPRPQPAFVRQTHSVAQSALDGPSTIATTQQFVKPRISGNVTNGTQVNATLQPKKEQDALRVLTNMRSSATTNVSDAAQSVLRVDAQSAPTNVSPTSRNPHVRLPVQSQTSDWPSITSTHSGSGVLMHGAIVGHSEGAILPPQKRRKQNL